MATIILDTSSYKAATGRVPPKTGAVKALFTIGDQQAVSVSGASFAKAVNKAKQVAREAGIYTVVLQAIAHE